MARWGHPEPWFRLLMGYLSFSSCGTCWGWNVRAGFFTHMLGPLAGMAGQLGVGETSLSPGWLGLFHKYGHQAVRFLLWQLASPRVKAETARSLKG